MSKDKFIGYTPAAAVTLGMGNMDNFLAAVTEGGIEAQEAVGQKSFVASDRMPVSLRIENNYELAAKPIYEKLGFVFGRVLDGQDQIFQEAKLPTGWFKRASNHSMWSKLLDEQERVRGLIFFKAAFYDYRANARLSCRYGVEERYGNDPDYTKNCKAIDVVDYGVRFTGEDGPRYISVYSFGTVLCENYEASRAMHKQAEKWLDRAYPQHSDVLAYW